MSRLRIDAPLASGKACGTCRYFTRSPHAVETARALQEELRPIGEFDPDDAGVCAFLPDLVVISTQACCQQWNERTAALFARRALEVTRNWTGGMIGRSQPPIQDPLFDVMKSEKPIEAMDNDQIDSQRFHNIEKGQ